MWSITKRLFIVLGVVYLVLTGPALVHASVPTVQGYIKSSQTGTALPFSQIEQINSGTHENGNIMGRFTHADRKGYYIFYNNQPYPGYDHRGPLNPTATSFFGCFDNPQNMRGHPPGWDSNIWANGANFGNCWNSFDADNVMGGQGIVQTAPDLMCNMAPPVGGYVTKCSALGGGPAGGTGIRVTRQRDGASQTFYTEGGQGHWSAWNFLAKDELYTVAVTSAPSGLGNITSKAIGNGGNMGWTWNYTAARDTNYGETTYANQYLGYADCGGSHGGQDAYRCNFEICNVPVNIQRPPAPLGLRATCNASGTQITLAWDRVQVASSYRLRLDKAPDSFNNVSATPNFNCQGTPQPGDTCKDDANPKITGTTYTTSIEPNTKYKFWVHSVNADGVSDPSQKYTGNTSHGNIASPEGFSCNGGAFSLNLQAESGMACTGYSLLNWGSSNADSVKVEYKPYNNNDPVANRAPKPADSEYITVSNTKSGTYPLYIPGPADLTWTVRATAKKAGQADKVETRLINCTSNTPVVTSNVFHKSAPRNTLDPEIYRDNVQMTWEAYTPPAGQPTGVYHVIACPAAAGSKCGAGSRVVDRWVANTPYPQTFGSGIGLTFDTAYYWQVYWAPREGFQAVAQYTEDGWVQLAQMPDSP